MASGMDIRERGASIRWFGARRLALAVLVVASATASGAHAAGGFGTASPEPGRAGVDGAGASLPRLVSLNPSLSSILVRLGAERALVGIDDYTAEVVPRLSNRPRVGGLFDPNVEAVVALRPDRVLIVAGVDQAAHAERLRRVGLEVDVFRNERFDEVLENIERLGRLVGREAEAADRIESIRLTRAAVALATKASERPRTIAVVDRSPLFLVGRDTFLDDMLVAAGAENVVRPLGAGYPRGAIEWLIAARPALLLDMTPGGEAATAFWSRWPSLPAVRAGRVVGVEASRISLPGPDLDRAIRELAVLIHGPEIEAEITRQWDRVVRPIDSGRAAP